MAFGFIPDSQVMSDLLTIREKGILVNLLEPQCKLIKTTVAQLLEANDSQNESPGWHRSACGVLCLIEDDSVCSCFLRLYCVKGAKLLWEQEIFTPFKYTAARSYFHTFPADVHQVGLNFANEAEAEEFLLAVKSVQERTNTKTDVAITGKASSASHYSHAPRYESEENSNEERHFPVDMPSTTASLATYSFTDLEPTMRRLLMQARLTEEDLKDKDVAEAVDCIIQNFGGLKAVQKELRRRGPVAQTLPRSASMSLALQKGPLPPVPPAKHSTASQEGSHGSSTQRRSQFDTWASSRQTSGAERKRKSVSFKHVGNSEAKGELILNALKEVFKQKQMLQQNTSEEANNMDRYQQ
ncbi:actin nucleation-promoting factor WASL [Menidia menidia]